MHTDQTSSWDIKFDFSEVVKQSEIAEHLPKQFHCCLISVDVSDLISPGTKYHTNQNEPQVTNHC